MPRISTLSRQYYTALVVSLGVLSMFVGMFVYTAGSLPNSCMLLGDYPFLGLRTFSALKGQLLEGPYSRLGFSHPSPILFYIYAGVRLLSNASIPYLAESLGQLAVNLLCLYLTAGSLCRSNFNPPLGHVLALIAAVLYITTQASPFILVDFWNPSTLVIPMLTTTIALPSYLLGDRKSCLALVIALSILLAQHLSTAIFVVLLITAALLTFIIVPARRPRSLTELCYLTIPLILTSMPALIDLTLNGSKSNPFRIIKYVANRQTNSHSLEDVLTFMENNLLSANSGIIVIISLLLLLLLALRSPRCRIILVFSLLVVIMTVLGATKSPGKLQPYLFFHLYGLFAGLIVELLSTGTALLHQRIPNINTNALSILLFLVSLIIVPPAISQTLKLPCTAALPKHLLSEFGSSRSMIAINTNRFLGWQQAGALGYALALRKQNLCFHPKYRKHVAAHLLCSPNNISTQIIFNRKNKHFVAPTQSQRTADFDPQFEAFVLPDA